MTSSPHQIVAAEIRAELARQRIPQIRLAELLGVSQVSISRRLRGETPFAVNELAAVADFLGIPTSSLLPGSAA